MADNNLTARDKKLLEKLLEIVLDNLSNEQFGVSELSKEIGLNRSHLFRKIKLLKGQSISQFIREVRLKEAYKLIISEGLTASEVAYRVGFNNPSYFNNCFHDYYGFPPGDAKQRKLETPLSKNIDTKVTNERKVILKSWYMRVGLGLIIVLSAIVVFSIFWKTNHETGEKSIAILPFDNLSPDEENQYFVDGLVDDLLSRLSRIGDLKVISRTSSEMFRDKGEKSVPEIAKILGANYILEGSIQKENNKIKVVIQLIDAQKDDHVLSNQYYRNLNEIFDVQSEIAQKITSELSIALSNSQLAALKKNKTNNLKAFEYYRLGIHYACDCSTEDNLKGISYFKKAIKEDSLYALAYAEIANVYAKIAQTTTPISKLERKAYGDTAIYYARKALDIDPNLASVHIAFGILYAHVNWKWELAEKEYQKAIELDPNYSLAYLYYAKLLHIQGKYKKARTQINKAIELDPLAFNIRYYSAYFYYNTEQFDKAWSEVQVCLDLDENDPNAASLKYDLYLRFGNDSAVYEIDKKIQVESGRLSPEEYDSIYNIGGNAQITRWFLEETFWPPEYEHYKAVFYAMLQEKEMTLKYLEMGLDSNKLDPWETTLWEYKFLRSEPRFIAVRKKMGLPPLK